MVNSPAHTDLAEHLRKVRDLTLLTLDAQQYLVVACDSDGGIGSKPNDQVHVSEEILGLFAVRVPLFELIAAGANPVLVVNCLAVEMDGTGAKILAAIRQYAAKAGLVSDLQFTGSTEENVPTTATGVGIMVLGLVSKDHFFPGTARSGDMVAVAGLPKSAPRFRLTPDDAEIMAIEDLLKLRRMPVVRDILPVGSKGLLYEARQLAASAGCSLTVTNPSHLDLLQSAGPASCVLFSAPRSALADVAQAISAPVHDVGCLT